MAEEKKPRKRAFRSDTATVKAVRALIRELEQNDPDAGRSAEAALAIAMAKRIDHPDTTAAAAASCGRVMQGAITDLRSLAPDEQNDTDPLDRISKSIADRMAAP